MNNQSQSPKQNAGDYPIFTAIVMGMTGAGKSTLINSIFGKEVAKRGISADAGITDKVTLYDMHTKAISLISPATTFSNESKTVNKYDEDYRVKIYDVPGFDKNGFDLNYYTKIIKDIEINKNFSDRPNVIIYCSNPNTRFNVNAQETQFINNIREFTKTETGRELPIVFACTKSSSVSETLLNAHIESIITSINSDTDSREMERKKTLGLGRISRNDIIKTLAMEMDVSSDNSDVKTVLPAFGVNALVQRAHQKCRAGVECARRLYINSKQQISTNAVSIGTVATIPFAVAAGVFVPDWVAGSMVCALGIGASLLGGIKINLGNLDKLKQWYQQNETAAHEYLNSINETDRIINAKKGDRREKLFKSHINKLPNKTSNTEKIQKCSEILIKPLAKDYNIVLTDEQAKSLTAISVKNADSVNDKVFLDELAKTYREITDELYKQNFSDKSGEEKSCTISCLANKAQERLNNFCRDAENKLNAKEPVNLNQLGDAIPNKTDVSNRPILHSNASLTI